MGCKGTGARSDPRRLHGVLNANDGVSDPE